MAKRLVRAKAKIRNAGIPYRVPPAHAAARTYGRGAGRAVPAVQRGIRGYRRGRPGAAEPVRRGHPPGPAPGPAHAGRARGPRAARADAAASFPARHPARRHGRAGHAGAPGPRRGGTRARSARASALLETALRRRRPGPYQVQAAIAACHATAMTAAETDWVEIAALYGELARLVPSAVVELNRAVAVAMADGPAAGLALVDGLRSRRRAGRLPPAARHPRRPATPPAPGCRGRGRRTGRPSAWPPPTPSAAT